MKKTLPDHLINRFTELTNDIEAAIRADERHRILAKVKREMNPPLTGKFGEPVPVGMNTGMHGESLAGDNLPAAGRVMNRTQHRLLGYLEKGYIAVPTLAGNLNIRKQSVHTYLNVLKKAGYDIESRNTGNNRGGYNKIYRLAKSA